MTPNEKADELVTMFRRRLPMNLTTFLDAKGCALIAVDEILEQFKYIVFIDDNYRESNIIYWEEVKQEIEKL